MLSTVRPEIPQATNSQELVDACVEHGAALIKNVLDADTLVQAVSRMTSGTLFEDDRQLADGLLEAESMPLFADLAKALSARGLHWFNVSRMMSFESGFVSAPHIDDYYPIEDVSLLVPLVHGAEFWVHSDDWTTSSGRVEFASEYWPGSALLLRQEIPQHGFGPKKHSSNVLFNPSVDSEARLLLTLDYTTAEPGQY